MGACYSKSPTKEAAEASPSKEAQHAAGEPAQGAAAAAPSYERQSTLAGWDNEPPLPPVRLSLLVSPKARDAEFNKALRRLRTKDGHDVVVHELKRPQDAGDHVRQALEAAATDPAKRFDAFVAVGGDDTVNAVVSGLVGAKAPESTCLAVVPRGDGPHNVAEGLGIPRDAYGALRVAAAAESAPVDVGSINDGKRVFLNSVLAGIAAEPPSVAGAGATKEALGMAAYLLLPPPEEEERGGGFSAEDARATHRFGAAEESGQLLFLAVSNGRYTRDGLDLSPEAELGDGLFDIKYAYDGSDEKALTLARHVAAGAATAELRAELEATRASWLELHAPAKLTLLVDGQPYAENDFYLEVLPQRLRITVPGGQLPPPGPPLAASAAVSRKPTPAASPAPGSTPRGPATPAPKPPQVRVASPGSEASPVRPVGSPPGDSARTGPPPGLTAEQAAPRSTSAPAAGAGAVEPAEAVHIPAPAAPDGVPAPVAPGGPPVCASSEGPTAHESAFAQGPTSPMVWESAAAQPASYPGSDPNSGSASDASGSGGSRASSPGQRARDRAAAAAAGTANGGSYEEQRRRDINALELPKPTEE